MNNAAEAETNPGLLALLDQILSEYGVVVLVLTFIILFGCFLIWKLIWKVWSTAMKAKDDEIARLAQERDKYQALVFDRLRTSQILIPEKVVNPTIEHDTSRPAIESPKNREQGTE